MLDNTQHDIQWQVISHLPEWAFPQDHDKVEIVQLDGARGGDNLSCRGVLADFPRAAAGVWIDPEHLLETVRNVLTLGDNGDIVKLTLFLF